MGCFLLDFKSLPSRSRPHSFIFRAVVNFNFLYEKQRRIKLKIILGIGHSGIQKLQNGLGSFLGGETQNSDSFICGLPADHVGHQSYLSRLYS